MTTERRKNLRSPLGLPLRVQGFRADGSTWEELTTTVDLSAGGACFSLGHEADLGQVLLLSLPLPRRLRQYDVNDATYRVYALVRGVRRQEEQQRIGVMFFGKYPPRGFKERPAARYLLPTDSIVNAPVPQGLRPGEAPSLDTLVGTSPGPTSADGSPSAGDSGPAYTPPPMTAPSTIPKGRSPMPPPVPGAPAPAFDLPEGVTADRRSANRVQLFVNFTLQLVDEWGAVLQEELTVADNVAKGGARVMTSFAFQVGDVLLLQEAGGGFATRAEVRAITKIQPTVDRLHLHFLDRQAPDRLLKR